MPASRRVPGPPGVALHAEPGFLGKLGLLPRPIRIRDDPDGKRRVDVPSPDDCAQAGAQTAPPRQRAQGGEIPRAVRRPRSPRSGGQGRRLGQHRHRRRAGRQAGQAACDTGGGHQLPLHHGRPQAHERRFSPRRHAGHGLLRGLARPRRARRAADGGAGQRLGHRRRRGAARRGCHRLRRSLRRRRFRAPAGADRPAPPRSRCCRSTKCSPATAFWRGSRPTATGSKARARSAPAATSRRLRARRPAPAAAR